MSDLVERLREGVNGQAENFAMRNEAAARIEQLEVALRQIAALDQKIVPASDRLAIARSLARAALAPEQDK
jgi:hypothetical protein